VVVNSVKAPGSGGELYERLDVGISRPARSAVMHSAAGPGRANQANQQLRSCCLVLVPPVSDGKTLGLMGGLLFATFLVFVILPLVMEDRKDAAPPPAAAVAPRPQPTIESPSVELTVQAERVGSSVVPIGSVVESPSVELTVQREGSDAALL
jgi:hypothetical protein